MGKILTVQTIKGFFIFMILRYTMETLLMSINREKEYKLIYKAVPFLKESSIEGTKKVFLK